MSASFAAKCFTENLDRFANSKTEPEKFNLYNGLRALAEAIANLEQEVRLLQGR